MDPDSERGRQESPSSRDQEFTTQHKLSEDLHIEKEAGPHLPGVNLFGPELKIISKNNKAGH